MELATGGQLVVQTLKSQGVDTIFGIPGIHNLGIYDALYDSGIRHVTTRHEQGAGFMADGYARSTGQVGVALVISGPGMTNILTPMGEAYHDSVPMVVISSEIPTAWIGKGCGFLHELRNATTVMGAVAKESRCVTSAAAIPDALADAFRLAVTGRPGPVHVAVPMDVINGACREEAPIPDPKGPSPLPPLDGTQLDAAAQRLAGAERPVMYLGGGAAGAAEELTRLAERLDMPVLQSMAGKGVVSEDHPLCIGTRIHLPSVREYVAGCDVMLAVGTEISPADLWEFPLQLGGSLIQVDVDAANFDRNFRADIGIRGDAAEAASALMERLDVAIPIGWDTVTAVAGLVKRSREEVNGITGMGGEFPLMLDVLQGMRAGLPEEGKLFIDMAGAAYVALSEFPARHPRTFHHPVGFGTLGYALPGAIGAKLAEPTAPVCVFSGDGGFQFTLPELAVAAQEGLTLPIMIWNDGGYGEIRRNEAVLQPGRRIAVDLRGPELQSLAGAYGIAYEAVENGAETEQALQRAFARQCPTLIDVQATPPSETKGAL
ncbi:MAG: 5-guanidino-2-oxopentanoate decarboxylase [Synergistales bacterium]|nr:5-guanidino-2-oxopentanoate decarboxylase [Synergistales bacterium]